MAKKKKVGASADLSPTAPGTRIDNAKRRRPPTGVKKAPSKKSNTSRKAKSPRAIAHRLNSERIAGPCHERRVHCAGVAPVDELHIDRLGAVVAPLGLAQLELAE